MDALFSLNNLNGNGAGPALGPGLSSFGSAAARAAGSGCCCSSNAASGGMQNQMVQQVMMGLLQMLSQLMTGQSGMSDLSGGSSGGGGLSGSNGGNALSGGSNAGGSPNSFAPAGNSAALGPLPPGNTTDQNTIKDFIRRAAGAYGADPNVLTEIARRESNFRPDAVNNWDSNAKKGTPSKGMFQFIEPTFNSFAPKARAANPEAWEGLGELNWMDWRQQALVTAWAIKNGLGSHWATYKAAGGR